MTYGYNTVTGAANGNQPMLTANATREDFNIEDLHCSVIYKMQRQRKLLKEIEMNLQERK